LLTAEDDCGNNIDESKVSDIIKKGVAIAEICPENLPKNATARDCLYNPTHQLKIQVKYTLVIIVMVNNFLI